MAALTVRKSTNIHMLLPTFYWIVRDPTEESSQLCHLCSTWFNKTAESQLLSFPESFPSDFEAQEILTKQQRTDSTVPEIT